MTQFPHDQFIKDYLPELLGNYGTATAAVEVAIEVREIDVLFVPNQPVPTDILGLLGQLAQTTSLFEVFRNPVTTIEILTCMSKLFDWQKNLVKEAHKNKQSFKETELAQLWILTPTLSQNVLESFRAFPEQQQWSTGVYLLAKSLRTGIIVIHQLPVTPETLWLRILGRGKVQQKALNELESLPTGHPYKEIILELVYKLLSILEVNRRSGQTIEPEDIELIMRISTLYTEKLLEATQQGVQQGEANLTIRQLKRLLGELPTEVETLIACSPVATLEALAEALFDFQTLEDLTNWLAIHQ